MDHLDKWSRVNKGVLDKLPSSLTEDVDHLSCSKGLSGPPFHGDLSGQSTQVSHPVGIGVVVQGTSSLTNETHARFTGTDQ